MNLETLSFLFNRALSLTFIRRKLIGMLCILGLVGLFVVFFRGLSLHTSEWMQLNLTFLPVFLSLGILLATGIFLIRLYYHEVRKQEVSYTDIFKRSWEILLGASYFAIPILICYILLWMLLGLFVLLSQTPVLGKFFSVILAFVPFLIQLGILILCVISLFLLFYVAPAIAFKGLEKNAVTQTVIKQLEANLFLNILLLLIALIPIGLVLTLLFIATALIGTMYIEHQTVLQQTLQSFVVMFPFTACLTPSIIFFFNFAAESYMFMQKYVRK